MSKWAHNFNRNACRKDFVTINKTQNDGQPFEVFINASKAGSETAAVSEAIGRLISYILRLPSETSPIDRLYDLTGQLSLIGGSRSLGMGPNRVRSLPDGISQALRIYIQNFCADLIEPSAVEIVEKEDAEWQENFGEV